MSSQSISLQSPSIDTKHSEPSIQTPIEANWLKEFYEKKENVFWINKVKDKYPNRYASVSLSYPLILERIVNAANLRNRSNEIYKYIELYLSYFDKYSLSSIRNINLKNEQLLFKYWPIYMYGYDKQGHPVFYDELASTNASELINVFTTAATAYDINDDKDDYDHTDMSDNIVYLWRMFRFKFYSRIRHQKEIQSRKYSTTIFKHILIMDIKDFSYFQIASNWSTYAKIVKTVISDEQLLYPETLYKLYLINCPWTFTFVWQIISTFIDPGTYKKIKCLGNDFLNEILTDIDINQIPKRYGGNGSWNVRLGFAADTDIDIDNDIDTDNTDCDNSKSIISFNSDIIGDKIDDIVDID